MKWEDLRLTEFFGLPGKAIFFNVPKEWFVDKITQFCNWAGKDGKKLTEIADFVGGRKHRFKGGHDLFIDVPRTFFKDGFENGIKHIKHLLTDFVTTDGIPFGGFSEKGLGNFLVNKCGVHWRKCCVNVVDLTNICEKGFNIVDKGIGFLCIGEGGMDILNAFSGKMEMNFTTFCDTFGEGAFQLAFGIPTGNGLAITAGVENIVAGIVSTWKTFTINIDLVSLFGGALTSTIIGFLTSKYICRNDTQESVLKAAKSGLITGLFNVSSSFGYGAVAGVAYMEYVKFLAKRDSKEVAKYMQVDEHCYERFIDVLNKIEDKEVRDAYIEYDNDIADDIVSSQYSLISDDDMKLALSAMNKQEYKLGTTELKKLTQGDFLVNYLERE